jgi:hypothetical protein
MKCNETQGKWCKNKHGASKIIDTFETYHFSMLMMHGVEFDADKVMSTYPKDKDRRDKSPKGYLERSRDLSARMTSFLAKRNERRTAARA